jgi:hypothetical protein
MNDLFDLRQAASKIASRNKVLLLIYHKSVQGKKSNYTESG